MKSKVIATVSHLRIYPSTREVITKKGTKTYREGALILMNEVGGTTAIELSAKQLDNLAGIANVNVAGKEGWFLFKGLIGVGRAKAVLALETYKAGDEYVGANNVVGKHEFDGTNVSVEVIQLADTIQNKLDDAITHAVVNWKSMLIPDVVAVADGSADGMDS